MNSLLAGLDVFHGDLTAARALVYARLPRPPDEGGWSLSGHVRGPRCLHAETLPLISQLVDLGPGQTLLARASIPDPVFWAPELPAIYDVTVNLMRGGEVIAAARREIGLRALGTHGRNLVFGGQNWVLRGVRTSSTSDMRPRFWHDASSALVADEFDADTLTEASEWGALAAIHVPGNDFAARLRELSRFPAAAIALLGEPLPEDFDPRASAPNLLLGQIIESDDPPPRDPRVHLVFAGADLLVHSTLVRSTGKPIIVIRRLSAPRSLSEARAACDELQRDLAPLGQFAGYIV